VISPLLQHRKNWDIAAETDFLNRLDQLRSLIGDAINAKAIRSVVSSLLRRTDPPTNAFFSPPLKMSMQISNSKS
jgi:hypothetical protein